MSLPGAFKAQKKDGTVYYRASVTYKNKHISLGSFAAETDASSAYYEAQKIVSSFHLIIRLSIFTFASGVNIVNFLATFNLLEFIKSIAS